MSSRLGDPCSKLCITQGTWQSINKLSKSSFGFPLFSVPLRAWRSLLKISSEAEEEKQLLAEPFLSTFLCVMMFRSQFTLLSGEGNFLLICLMIQLSREVMWKGRRKNHCYPLTTKLQETPFDPWRFGLSPLFYATQWTGDVLREIINASRLWARCSREGAECYQGMTHRWDTPSACPSLGSPAGAPEWYSCVPLSCRDHSWSRQWQRPQTFLPLCEFVPTPCPKSWQTPHILLSSSPFLQACV